MKTNNHNRLSQIAVLGLIAGLAVALFASPSPASWDDGLRHLTMARTMQVDGITQTWSHFFYGGYLATHAVNPWFLADVSYIPFTFLPDIVALKTYALVAAAALLFVLRKLIQPMEIPEVWKTILLATLFSSPTFLGRLEFGRPFVWQTVFCLLILDAASRQKYRIAGVVMIVATLFSHLFVFPLLFGMVGAAWIASTGKWRMGALFGSSAFAGTAIGMLLHPAPAAYASYIATVFFRTALNAHTVTQVPELLPGALVDLSPALLGCMLAFLAIGHVALGKRFPLKDFHAHGGTLVLTISGAMLIAYLAAWARIIDILWPMEIVLAGTLCASLRPTVEELIAAPKKFLGRSPQILLASLLITVPVAAVSSSALHNVRETKAHDLSQLSSITEIPPGSRVLNIDWRLCAAMILVNPELRFATGLDNTFTWIEDERAYALLEALRRSDPPLSIADAHASLTELLKRLPADFVVIGESSAHVLPAIRTMPNLREVYESGGAVHVFRVEQQ